MEIVDFGFFRVTEPNPTEPQILLFRNEDGQDWYELRSGLTHWNERGHFVNAIYGAWAMVDAEGVVTNVEHDPSRLMPGNRRVLGIDASPEEVQPGMCYVQDALLPPAGPDLKAYLADKRWQTEVGGIEVGGVQVATDDRSKMMIMGARMKAEADPSFTTQWKSGDTFVTLNATTLIAISEAVLAHVDNCFAIEAQVRAGIDKGTIRTVAEIDHAFAPPSPASTPASPPKPGRSKTPRGEPDNRATLTSPN